MTASFEDVAADALGRNRGDSFEERAAAVLVVLRTAAGVNDFVVDATGALWDVSEYYKSRLATVNELRDEVGRLRSQLRECREFIIATSDRVFTESSAFLARSATTTPSDDPRLYLSIPPHTTGGSGGSIIDERADTTEST